MRILHVLFRREVNCEQVYFSRVRVCVWRPLQVDFWSPDSADVVTIDTDVDIHIDALHASMVYTILNQSDMEHE